MWCNSANQTLTELQNIICVLHCTAILGIFPLVGSAQTESDYETNKFDINKIDSLFEQGVELHSSGLNDSAVTCFNNAIEIARMNSDSLALGKLYLAKGKALLTDFGPRDKATRVLMESLELYTLIKDNLGIANSNLQLGVLSYDMEQYAAAVVYFNKVLDVINKSYKTYAIAEYLLALTYSELHEFEIADSMYVEASKRYGKIDSSKKLLIQTFRGKMLINQGLPEAALDYFYSIDLSHSDSSIGPTELIALNSYISTAHLQSHHYKDAIRYGRMCYDKAINNGSTIIYLKEAQKNLHRAYYALNQFDSAYYFLNQLNIINDSISNNEISQRIEEIRGQYAYNQRTLQQNADQAIKDAINESALSREKFRSKILLGAIILAMLFAKLLFNQRNKIKREKRRSDDLLLNILPAKIAQELKTSGKAEPQHFRSVPILFSDFKSFTKKSMELTARELVSEIDSCFIAFDAIMERYGIEKIKTIGDSYMAAAGMPEPSPDAIERTILAGLEMQQFIQKRKQLKSNTNQIGFEMRVGIHVGPVIAGIVGSKKFQYDIWGDTVNTASRMESCGEVGKVNISHDTYFHMRNNGKFQFEDRGFIEAKGKGEIHMWFVSLATG